MLGTWGVSCLELVLSRPQPCGRGQGRHEVRSAWLVGEQNTSWGQRHEGSIRRPESAGESLGDTYGSLLESIVGRAAYTMGPELAQFEEEFAEPTAAASFAVGVSSGTDALKLAYLAAGVGPGDEVIVPGEHVHRHRRGGLAHRGTSGVRRLPGRDGEHRPAPDRGGASPIGREPSSPSTSTDSPPTWTRYSRWRTGTGFP